MSDGTGLGLGLGIGMVFFWLICVILLTVLPFYKIFSRAGFNGWLSLLMLVPLANIIMLFYLAFAEWPRDRAGA